jgi:hypothetical protein
MYRKSNLCGALYVELKEGAKGEGLNASLVKFKASASSARRPGCWNKLKV